ncbi:hypothetical protein tinsulaeT_13770 [Thalassotalea insulae]|uniref:Uncharacterized protein n=1 Tax=Thalassotalea insulae TaxID=2056778 RepID=A0ABQ6GRK3_9GAMM|nr:hypothetical protein [Thalassotalea insulae]GLX78037.1 hypothetical protein tinsulaeT_13770 [Thalassotalea insulae]
MYLKYLLLLITIFIVACNSEQQEKLEEKSTVATSEKSVTEPEVQSTEGNEPSSENLKEQLLNSKLGLKKPSMKSLTINNERLRVTDAKLLKGTQVYNKMIRQTGTVKGTIVIVTTELDKYQSQLKSLPVSEIAKQTYRIDATSLDNLNEFYRELLAMDWIKQVELEIDYSGPAPGDKRETK